MMTMNNNNSHAFSTINFLPNIPALIFQVERFQTKDVGTQTIVQFRKTVLMISILELRDVSVSTHELRPVLIMV